jgi:chitin disaccharide deacetylase
VKSEGGPRRLIVTADDVGLHPAMTSGALRCHLQGIVTACSVVANGEAFGDAVERLRDAPTMSVGVHLTLVEELPLLKPFEIPSLVDTNGRLYRSFTRFVPRFFAGAIHLEDVERELRAQIEKVLASGLPVRHANGHQHLHLLPRIFDLLVRLCAEYQIPYIRTVSEETKWSLRGASIAALSRMGRFDRKHVSTLRTNDRTIGVTDAGRDRAGVPSRVVAGGRRGASLRLGLPMA